MNKVFNADQKIGEIVNIFPKVTDIFMKYQIDFCCGGDRPLAEAIKEQNIDEEILLTKLNDAFEQFDQKVNENTDWRNESSSSLIDYIVNKHHRFLREELPITEQLVSKILRVHYAHSGELLSKVYKLFSNLKTELEEHLIKEEEILFPLIKQYENNQTEELRNKINQVIDETESEHDTAGIILKEMRALTNDYELPESACKTYIRTYENLKAIESDLFHHIHLENNILFNRTKVR